jgi:hypothetical protein
MFYIDETPVQISGGKAIFNVWGYTGSDTVILSFIMCNASDGAAKDGYIAHVYLLEVRFNKGDATVSYSDMDWELEEL